MYRLIYGPEWGDIYATIRVLFWCLFHELFCSNSGNEHQITFEWVYNKFAMGLYASLYYPRPVMAFRYCHRLRLCVCVSVNHKFVRAITCHPWKLQSPKLDKRCKTPKLRSLLFLGFTDLDLQGEIEHKSQNLPHFGLVSCPRDKSIPNEVRLSKCGPTIHLSTIKVPLDFGIDWSWSSVSFLTSNLLYSTEFCVSYSFASVCIYLVRPLPLSVPHPTWHRTYTDSYACGQGPAIDRETV